MTKNKKGKYHNVCTAGTSTYRTTKGKVKEGNTMKIVCRVIFLAFVLLLTVVIATSFLSFVQDLVAVTGLIAAHIIFPDFNLFT